MTIVRNKFDFEIGHLIKSPCKECHARTSFPECIDACNMLDEIQTLLAQGISCSRNFSAVESYALLLEGWERK